MNRNKKFNLLDAAIILVLIGVIAGAIFRSEIKQFMFSDENAVFTVTVKISDIDNSRAALLIEGSELAFSNNKYFGTVKETDKTPVSEIYIIDGVEKTIQSSTRSDVLLTLTVPGYISGDVYCSDNGTELLVASYLTLESENQIVDCRISDIAIENGKQQ